MKASKDLVGKPIVSITDGRILGKVNDIYLDRELRHVVAVHSGYEGLLRRKAQMIPRDQVVLFGEDTILVRQSDVILPEDQVEGGETWIRRDQLSGRNVDTPGGTRIAKLDDVILDDQAGVIGFVLGRTYIESPVAESGAISREVVVDTGAEDGVMTIELEKAEQEHFQFPSSPEKSEEPPVPEKQPVNENEESGGLRDL
jgi:uncharacterized protein YrrD